MKKVALIGGSFDPIHNGHLEMGRAALRELQVDEVWFLPTRQTPLKERSLTDPAHRLAMLRLAVQENEHFRICDADLKRSGPSYSVDTLEILHRDYPDTEFYWLIGADQAAQFDRWKDPARCLQLAQFVAVDRNGKGVQDAPFQLPEISMRPVAASSTQIRNGEVLNELPESILQYILDNELYIRGWLPSRMSAHRYAHSCSVAQLCRSLARAHGLDEHTAFLCGLFHDIAKDLPKDELQKWVAACWPEALSEHHAIWHGYAGSEIVDRIFGIHSPVIKNAIAHHVKGTSYDPYAMIVFIADKLDPLRQYDSSALTELAMKDLYNGFMMVKAQNKAFLEKEKKKS